MSTETTANCDKCGVPYNHYETFYTDRCDECTVKTEGKTIAELEKEDSKYDHIGKGSIEIVDIQGNLVASIGEDDVILQNGYRVTEDGEVIKIKGEAK
jgi:protein-arginine kinase activator protein McsA